jgi:hypothetical protein
LLRQLVLFALVIVFHTWIAYAGTGSLYYEDFDKNAGLTSMMVVFSIFTAVVQAFFMSLFFSCPPILSHPRMIDRKDPLKKSAQIKLLPL